LKYNQQVKELTEYFEVLKALGQPVDLHTYIVHFDTRVINNIRRSLLKDFSIAEVWKSPLLEFFTMLENSLGDQVFKLHGYCTIYSKNVMYTAETEHQVEGPSNILTVGMIISLHKSITRT
jgi:hypothetical protein